MWHFSLVALFPVLFLCVSGNLSARAMFRKQFWIIIDAKDIPWYTFTSHGIQGALLCSLCYWDIFFLLLLVKTKLFLNDVTVLQQHILHISAVTPWNLNCLRYLEHTGLCEKIRQGRLFFIVIVIITIIISHNHDNHYYHYHHHWQQQDSYSVCYQCRLKVIVEFVLEEP